MGMFDKIKEAQINEGGVYILPGIYRCQILACKQRQTRKGVNMIAVELRVIESTNPERPAGTDMSWVVTMDKDAALGNVKQFVATVMECEVKEVDTPGTELIFSEANPLKGTMVRVSAVNKKTKNGGDFTLVKWIGDKDGAQAALAAHAVVSSDPVPADQQQ